MDAADAAPAAGAGDPASGPAAAAPAPATAALDYEDLYDRIYGAILGQAAGDAMALQVEDCDRYTIQDRHPNGQLPYPQANRTFKGHPANDWTDATDCAVLLARTITAYMGEKTDEPQVDLAHRLAAWYKNGFPELGDGDTGGRGCEGVLMRAVTRPGFLTEPVEAAHAVQGPKSENGALIRTIACAFTTAPLDWARDLAQVSHIDPRCTASAVVYTFLVHCLWRAPADKPTPASIAQQAILRGRALLPEKFQAEYADWLARSSKLAALRLEDRENSHFTLKTLAVALWAFRKLVRTPPARRGPAFYQDALWEIAAQGGDTTANCAVAGGLFGAACGQAVLPAAWVDALPHYAWLQKEVESFISAAAPTWASA